jgi:hypothetical protein
MNEYYKKRYNISNYFLNVDTDDYYNNNSMVILFIAITLIIYTIYPIIFIITNKKTRAFIKYLEENSGFPILSPSNKVKKIRSEERRVGKECWKQCRSRWSPYH